MNLRIRKAAFAESEAALRATRACPDQRAICFASRPAGLPCLPLARVLSAAQIARSSRASIREVPQKRRPSVCSSATVVTLRLRSSRLYACSSLSRSPIADRSSNWWKQTQFHRSRPVQWSRYRRIRLVTVTNYFSATTRCFPLSIDNLETKLRLAKVELES